jgi:hypothetical protein
MKDHSRPNKASSVRLASVPNLILVSGLSCIFVASMAYADLGKSYREAEQLSSRDKLKFASSSRTEMQSALKYTLQELQSSYEKKDIIQTNCVKEKLSTVKGLLRISEEADNNLREAVITGQVDLVNHEYVKIRMAAERVKDLRVQVANCAKSMDDTLLNNQQPKSKPEVIDEAVQAFEPTADENAVIVYDPIATERPEAISASE